jgi:electron transport complex protein RnfG
LRDLIKMVVVLTAICSASALVLSYANQATKGQREYQLLKYVKEPSIKAVLSGYDNDPIKDRVTMELGKDDKGKPVQKNIFPAKSGGQVIALAYDSVATGYNGPVEVMVGIDNEGKLTGVSVMTHSETPGLGARVVEAEFQDQFRGLEISDSLNVGADGGQIDAVTGATTSSRAVVKAVRSALELFQKVKEEVS